MSALNAFARDTGAYILADTAQYHDNGAVLAIGSKVAANADLRIAVGIAGCVEVGAVADASEWLAKQTDQQQALSELPDLLRLLLAHDAEAVGNGALDICGPIPRGIRIVVALWDKQDNRAKAAIISSEADLGPPFTLRPLKSLFSPAFDANPWPGHSFDPCHDAQALAAYQRQVPDESGICRVGGQFECWRIDASGISRETVTDWHDVIGACLSGEARESTFHPPNARSPAGQGGAGNCDAAIKMKTNAPCGGDSLLANRAQWFVLAHQVRPDLAVMVTALAFGAPCQ